MGPSPRRCTLESTCKCPLDMTRLELPNTGPAGGATCFACRTKDPRHVVHKLSGAGDFDDDDDEEEEMIVVPTMGDDGEDEADEEEDEEPDLDELLDQISGSGTHRARLKCGNPHVCDCEEFR